MDFDLPEELQILRNTVRRFVDNELIPLEREYRHDEEGPMPERLLKPRAGCGKRPGGHAHARGARWRRVHPQRH